MKRFTCICALLGILLFSCANETNTDDRKIDSTLSFVDKNYTPSDTIWSWLADCDYEQVLQLPFDSLSYDEKFLYAYSFMESYYDVDVKRREQIAQRVFPFLVLHNKTEAYKADNKSIASLLALFRYNSQYDFMFPVSDSGRYNRAMSLINDSNVLVVLNELYLRTSELHIKVWDLEDFFRNYDSTQQHVNCMELFRAHYLAGVGEMDSSIKIRERLIEQHVCIAKNLPEVFDYYYQKKDTLKMKLYAEMMQQRVQYTCTLAMYQLAIGDTVNAENMLRKLANDTSNFRLLIGSRLMLMDLAILKGDERTALQLRDSFPIKENQNTSSDIYFVGGAFEEFNMYKLAFAYRFRDRKYYLDLYDYFSAPSFYSDHSKLIGASSDVLAAKFYNRYIKKDGSLLVPDGLRMR